MNETWFWVLEMQSIGFWWSKWQFYYIKVKSQMSEFEYTFSAPKSSFCKKISNGYGHLEVSWPAMCSFLPQSWRIGKNCFKNKSKIFFETYAQSYAHPSNFFEQKNWEVAWLYEGFLGRISPKNKLFSSFFAFLKSAWWANLKNGLIFQFWSFVLRQEKIQLLKQIDHL